MQNLKTFAAASALMCGIALFVLNTSRSPLIEHVQVTEAPARFTAVDAKPLSTHRPDQSSASEATELVSYTAASKLLAAAAVTAAPQPAEAATEAATGSVAMPGTRANSPVISGVYREDSEASGKLIEQIDPKTNTSKVWFKVSFPEEDNKVPKGTLTIRIGKSGPVREKAFPIADMSPKVRRLEFDVSTLEMKKVDEVVALWDPAGDGEGQLESLPSAPLKLWVDNVPPRILSVRLTGETGGIGILEIQFANNDLKREPIPKENFVINRSGGKHVFDTPHESKTLLPRADDSSVVQLNLGSLITDLYQIEVNKEQVTDQHGNELAEPNKFTFNSMPQADRGPHVQFPEYVRRKERQPQDLFNPGDKVETRVARLFYIRDAHRVAQIINRNVKSFNQSGVDRAKLTAKNARESAEQAVRDRQIKERDAIRAAEDTREVERNLASAKQQLEQTRAMFSQQLQAKDKIAVAEKQYDPNLEENKRIVTAKNEELTKLKATLADLTSQIQAQQKLSDEKAVSIEVLQTQLSNPSPDNAIEKLKADHQAAVDKQGFANSLIARLSDRKRKNDAEINTIRDAANPRQIELTDQNTEIDKKINETRTDSERLDVEIAQLDYKIKTPPTPTTAVDLQKAKQAKDLADKTVGKLTSQRTALTDKIQTTQDEYDSAKKQVAAAEIKSTLNPRALTPEKFKEEIARLAGTVAELEQKAAQKRQVEKAKQESTEQAQELEDRAKENQFRAEVAAGTEDPDTYVDGNPESIDPVTQVSISVIGEGVLQLRGPIRGINKIRTMINQIDTPLGQVKIGIFTVQINGEHGDRMEKVAARVEGHIDLSRFLTNQSLSYLRRAIQEVAGAVVANVDAQFPNQYRQIDRDRKYLYAFFGRDFIDELYEMDSEFLRTENKLLSLHGMDTVSQSQACFIMALSKNDIRQQILDRFRCLVECDLPQAEWDYRRTSGLLPCKLNSQKEVCRNAFEKYKFRNVHGFFEASVYGSDTMTPMQREFIRLAQIFKSQMIAEVELKQRVMERGLIEDQANDETARVDATKDVRNKALRKEMEVLNRVVGADDVVEEAFQSVRRALKDADAGKAQVFSAMATVAADIEKKFSPSQVKRSEFRDLDVDLHKVVADALQSATALSAKRRGQIATLAREVREKFSNDLGFKVDGSADANRDGELIDSATRKRYRVEVVLAFDEASKLIIQSELAEWEEVFRAIEKFRRVADNTKASFAEIDNAYDVVVALLSKGPPRIGFDEVHKSIKLAYVAVVDSRRTDGAVARARLVTKKVRQDLDHRKLLELLTDEQEEKYIELVEGTRSHIAQIDTYLKRLAIALEDDFKLQFYDPAFAGVRAASREWDVNLGQVERTTILTNNRQFAKVSPQATMEFDLPKRAPMIVEGMNGAKALVQEYGTLLQDPTFLSLSGMMSGTPAVGGAAASLGGMGPGMRAPAVRKPLSGQSTDSSEELMAQSGGPDRKFGAALEGLIPDPAVYKFETGTGFEIRPVIQPDGHSVIYDFDYMYTTNVREPVRPDEKHLGRVKRHFVHTQVQTASFELREISRYQVALKASRTSRGVPLLEDIPGAGALFRPLPSDESSFQQNIILGQSTVYPTLFDLMGLRWSKYVVDLDHIDLRDLEHVTRGREQSIRNFTFDEASKRVDEFLDIQAKQPDHVRRDFYHQQRNQSPYHPGGYHYQPKAGDEEVIDPRNRNFTIPDRRPEEYRNPAYDPLRRNPVDEGLRQYPTPGGMPEDVDLRLQPPEEVPASRTQGPSGVIPIPPSPASRPGAQKNSKSPASVIQPANFEQKSVRPMPRLETSGSARASSDPENPKPPSVTLKKTWLQKVMPTKTK